jgi:hypothetical protein
MPPKRVQFTLSEKASLRAHHAEFPALSQQELAQWFEARSGKHIHQGTVSEILSSRYSHLDSDLTKQPRRVKQKHQAYPELERLLADWIYHQQDSLTINADVVKEKARQFWHKLPQYEGITQPAFSEGWLTNFKARFAIRSFRRFGEAGSVDLTNMAADLAHIQAKVAQYAPADQYNCDETGLFWKLMPERGLSTHRLPGQKKEKARITIHHACNATGSHKLPMWVIGKHKQPRCFRASGVKDVEALGIKWRANKKAWMTQEIMVDWLRWFDQQMHGRKVLLLMDNFSAHVAAFNELESMPLGLGIENTEVVFLPPNTTSKLQPLDQGIIASFKARYRRSWIRFMLEQHDLGFNPLQRMHVLKAIQFSIRAWDEVTSTTISNCWGHSKVNLNPSQALSDVGSQEVIQCIENDLLKLRAQYQIQHLMDISQLLNPPEEEVADPQEDIEEMLIALHTPVDEQESDSEDVEQLPIISPQQVLEHLQSIKLGEIQADDCNPESIKWIERYEKVIRSRHQRGLKQAGIRSYLTAGAEARDQIDPHLM